MPHTLAFLSCMDAERSPQIALWEQVKASKPDALLLLGDHIYMDYGLGSALANVPAVKREWLRANGKEKAEIEDAFAQDMHSRYAMQWGIGAFRALVQGMNRQNILLTWDDHDFAWNNSLGLDGVAPAHAPDLNQKVVPSEFQRISLTLRRQFLDVLRAGVGDTYPDMPDLAALRRPTALGVPRQKIKLGDITVAVLDQRSYRTHRDATPARLLSDDDRDWLNQEVAKDEGLLILAGGSPLKHRSPLGSHTAWWAPADDGRQRSYPEYGQLVAHIERPVLYLAGEIHRNAWGGWVEPSPGDGSARKPIFQALSSGAGLGQLLFKKYPGSWGLVTIDGQARNAAVTVHLNALNAATETHKITVHNGQVQGRVDEGECTDPALTSDRDKALQIGLSTQPLHVLSCRAVAEPLQTSGNELFAPSDMDAHLLPDAPPGATTAPQAWAMTGETGGIRLHRHAGPDDGDRIIALWQAAFASARANGTSVVMFVHGFGKGMAASAAQALALRERFKVEPVLYTWPSGISEGFMSALSGYLEGKGRAADTWRIMTYALGSFCNAAATNLDVPAVLLVRSLGAQTILRIGADLGQPGNYRLGALRRVVFSAPACRTNPDRWLDALNQQVDVFITVNQNDRTLGWAKWVENGTMMGRDPTPRTAPRRWILDCTNVNGVNQSHDYMLRDVNAELTALNRHLLSGAPLDIGLLQVPGLVVKS